MILIFLFALKIKAKLAESDEDVSYLCDVQYCEMCLKSNTSHCLECKLGYTLDRDENGISKGTCVRCTDGGCGVCDTPDNCTKCQPYYGFGKEEGKTICKRCDDNLCLECYKNFAVCEKCNGVLKSSGICEKCDEGFDFLIDKCEPIPSNCKDYKVYGDSFKCNECYPHHRPNETDCYTCYDPNCYPCDDPNCYYCDQRGGQCYTCNDGFSRFDQVCVRCEVENCRACRDDLSVCTNCMRGYGLIHENSESTGKCGRCEDDRCDMCGSDNKICTYCRDSSLQIDSNGRCVVCPEGCNGCSSDGACYFCKTYYGNILDENGKSTGQCGKCPEYCKYCDSNSSFCEQCEEGWTLIRDENGNTGKCSLIGSCPYYYGKVVDEDGKPLGFCGKCPDNCSYCTENSNICTSCSRGFGLVLDEKGESTGICEKCSGFCKECSKDYTKCSKCEKLDEYPKIYFGPELDDLGEFTGRCLPCSANCDDCENNANFCESCVVGFTIIEDEEGNPTGKCGACPNHCYSCWDDISFCSECDDGYSLIMDSEGKSTGQCGKCPENCNSCDENFSACEWCADRYGLVLDENGDSTGKCEKCLVENCSYCKSNYKECEYCENDHKLVIDSDGKHTCKYFKCPDHCSCNGDKECYSCYQGYGKVYGSNNEVIGCEKCPTNCVTCDENAKICDNCEWGYDHILDENGFKTEKCARCGDGCEKCTSDKTRCLKCKSGYGFLYVDGIRQSNCTKCADPCYNCDEMNLTKCTNCIDGYYLYEENNIPTGECRKCIENCDSCFGGATICNICKSGFGVNKEQTCSPCKDSHCSDCRYNFNECRECAEGYNLINGICIGCIDEHCSNCFYDPKMCSLCEDGYGLEYNEDGERTGKCAPCGENCLDCKTNSNICAECKDGFGHAFENGKRTKVCKKCTEHCSRCFTNADKCIQCDEGFGLILNQDGTSSGKCGSCPANCKRCTYNNKICTECEPEYGIVQKETGDKKVGECDKCPENCAFCNYDSSFCLICHQDKSIKYGFYINADGTYTGLCKECPSNCQFCYSSDLCNACKDGYCLGNFHQCIPCGNEDITNTDFESSYEGEISDSVDTSDEIEISNSADSSYENENSNSADAIPCLVDGCILCMDGFDDKCAKCNSSLVLNSKNQCEKILVDVTVPPKPKPTFITPNYDSIKNGSIECNFDEANLGDAEQIVLQLDPEENPDEKITSITIVNTQNKNVAIEIFEGFNEITINVDEDTTNKTFDIISHSESPMTINLDPSTRASIKEAKGGISIGSTEKGKPVTINQIQPESDLTITPKSQIIIEEVEFYQNSEFIVKSKDNEKVQINSIKVQQLKTGVIHNATIKGTISLGLSSSLEINENVKIDDSTLEVSYNDEYNNNSAQVIGTLNSVPNKLKIVARDSNQILSEAKFLIAESKEKFECEAWGRKIEYIDPFDNFECTSSIPYRLYATNKGGNNDNKGKLSAGAIAGIVIAAIVFVGLIIFLLVYFLVIKKRNKMLSDGENSVPI